MHLAWVVGCAPGRLSYLNPPRWGPCPLIWAALPKTYSALAGVSSSKHGFGNRQHTRNIWVHKPARPSSRQCKCVNAGKAVTPCAPAWGLPAEVRGLPGAGPVESDPARTQHPTARTWNWLGPHTSVSCALSPSLRVCGSACLFWGARSALLPAPVCLLLRPAPQRCALLSHTLRSTPRCLGARRSCLSSVLMSPTLP